jgi:UTP--glucose-1-phosphate uridylyltransferase
MDRLSPALLADMASKGIDADLTLSILDDYNSGLYDSVGSVKAAGVPAIDGVSVVKMGPGAVYRVPAREARERLAELGLTLPASARAGAAAEASGAATSDPDGELVFPRAALEEIGAALLGRTAYGVLNGGSATSYADSKKNLAFGREVFEVLEPAFSALAPLCRDRPKGLTPAYLNPDGSPGESFLVLKMRARLVLAAREAARHEASRGAPTARAGAGPASARLGTAGSPGEVAAGGTAPPFLPLFQMTSVGNDAEIAAAYADYREHPFLAPLARRMGLDPVEWQTGVQPMLAAYTHSSEGRPKRVFDRAHGKSDSALALPGGHGQSFRVLASTLRTLRERGIRFAYLGNVDNVGYLPESAEIAVLALSGKPAGFDFSLRTSVDVKGGILVDTTEGGRTVADIGPAISFDEVRALEAGGASILFNCATGLFDLDYLVPRIEEIGRRLPVRFSDQDKDAGRYSQAEQVTWEVTSLLPGFVAFAVDKYDRFIAAKLLAETLLTSGVGAGDPRVPAELAETSRRLKRGLEAKLAGPYGLRLVRGRWVPDESV